MSSDGRESTVEYEPWIREEGALSGVWRFLEDARQESFLS